MAKLVPGPGDNTNDSVFQIRGTKRNRVFQGEVFDEEDAKLNFREGDFKKVLEHPRGSAQK